jgi:nicotinamide mononucleotide (NMN) deamidase PncC
MPLAAEAVAALAAKGLTLATAEATTGGLLGHLLTDIPGSSHVFRGGVAP